MGAFVGVVLVALVVWAYIKWIGQPSARHKAAIEANGGPSPNVVYRANVRRYYNNSNSGSFIETSIYLPSPFGVEWYRYKRVWLKDGYWQREWNAWCLGEPSIYSGDKRLPSPYAGPSNIGNPPVARFMGKPNMRKWWGDHLRAGTLKQAIADYEAQPGPTAKILRYFGWK